MKVLNFYNYLNKNSIYIFTVITVNIILFIFSLIINQTKTIPLLNEYRKKPMPIIGTTIKHKNGVSNKIYNIIR